MISNIVSKYYIWNHAGKTDRRLLEKKKNLIDKIQTHIYTLLWFFITHSFIILGKAISQMVLKYLVSWNVISKTAKFLENWQIVTYKRQTMNISHRRIFLTWKLFKWRYWVVFLIFILKSYLYLLQQKIFCFLLYVFVVYFVMQLADG